ncbi:MAG: fumarylacetoacetate hydrolase family protein [Chloroflexota bacterium]
MQPVDKAADLLMKVRATRQRIETLPSDCFPDTISAAYDIQAALIERLQGQHGGTRVGHKIGCTNEAAQRFLGLDGPFHGPLLSEFVHRSPARLTSDDFMMRVIEPEFGFQMAEDLPPKAQPYSQAEVTQAIGAMIPAIEIVESRYQNWTKVGAACLIADHAVHGVWVMGDPILEWKHLNLATHRVEFWLNGKPYQTGSGEVVLGNPLNVMTWLANALPERGQHLKAGDFVTTGICVDEIYDAQIGDTITVDFGELGSVEVIFE